MRLAVVDEFGRAHKVDGEAALAQRLASKLMPSESTPSSVVVGATSSVTASAAAFGMQAGEGSEAHRSTLALP
jgi:hypothetical protein